MAFICVFAYILLFVIKCRFPANKSVAEIIRKRYDGNVLKDIRRLEKLDYKLRKCDLDLEFLQTCWDNQLVPNFLRFKVTNVALKSSKAYQECQRKLLKQEVTNKKSARRTIDSQLKQLKDALVRRLSLVDFSHVISLFLRSNDAALTKLQEVHKKKLYNLGFFERDKDTNDPEQVIRNFSSYVLSDDEKSLLAKGLNFSLPPKKLHFADHMTPFELLYKNIQGVDISQHKMDILKVDLGKIAYSSFNQYNFLRELNISLPEYEALKKLSTCKDIVIHKSDKGNSVVIVNRSDYLNRLQEMVNDTSKFEELKVKPGKDYNFMKKEKSEVDDLLSELVDKRSISEAIREKLSPNGPNPARLYGLPKIHKPLADGFPKYRPIISQIGSPTYQIAKYLLEFVKPYTSNEYTVKDTFEFVSMLDDKDHRLVMGSLDVESLFTNIPLDETIDIITNKVFGKKRKVNGLSKRDFKRLLEISTKGTVFYFNGKYYKQKDGVAMGSPLGPALANAFLAHHETLWLEECPLSFAPIFFTRYVDDIFVLLRSSDHITRLAEYLSSRHPNIKFTYELENNNTLPFLDVNVFRDAGRFSSTVHRKSTFSGVYSNFGSFMPVMYKRGLVSTLLYRAYIISSSFQSLHKEIENLKKIFSKNGYPTKFVDKCILTFFNKLYEKREPVSTVPKKEVTIVLPFLGTTSWKIKKDLKRSFDKVLPFCSLKVVYKTARRLSSCFPFKDQFPKSLLSGVIYQFTCAKCNLSYYGCTKRYWEKRLEEHTHKSALTGKPLTGCQVFAPMKHARSCGCHVSRENFKLIGFEKDPYLLLVKESILIKKDRPAINGNEQSVPLALFT